MADRTVAVRLLLNPAGYVGGAAQVQRANASMTASTTATARRSTAATGAMTAGMQRTGQSIGSVAAQAGLLRGGMVNPITAAGAAVIGATKASIDWESAWAGVTKTVDGSATQMERLEGDLRGMARELPATHGEIAATAEAAGQLGVKVGDVEEFTRTMVDLGETTNLSASDAATSIARLTNIMGTSQDEVDRLGSSLVDLGNNSATTEAEILELGTRLAAAGNIAGLSEADVLAFAAAMTSVGVNAEAGGTAMSKVFTQMRDSVIDGGKQLEIFAAVAGTTAEEFATAFREDPAMAIAAFIDGMGRMNAAGQSTTGVFKALQLTDQRLMRAVLSTAEAGDLLTDSIDLASSAWEDNVALAAEAEQRYNTTSARISRSWNTIKDAAISGGEPVADVFAMLAEGAADLVTGVEKADNAFKNMFESAGLPTGKGEGMRDFATMLRDLGVPEDLLFTDFDAEEAEKAIDWSARFKSEIRGLQNRLPETADAGRDLNDVLAENATATADAADAIDRLTESLFAGARQAMALEEHEDALADAIDAAREATDDDTTSKDEQREALRNVAAEQLNLIEGLVEQGLSTEDAAEKTRNAREDFLDVADAMGIDAEKAEALADKYGLIPEDVETTVELINYQRSLERIANIQSQLDILDGSKADITIEETRQISTFFSTFGTQGRGGQNHDGGLIMHGGGSVSGATRMHSGGLRSDERQRILQTGEFVMQRSAVDRMGLPAMHAINQGRAIPIPAGGGGHDSVGGHLTGNLYLSSGEFLGVVQGQVKQGISEHDRGLNSRVRQGTGRAR